MFFTAGYLSTERLFVRFTPVETLCHPRSGDIGAACNNELITSMKLFSHCRRETAQRSHDLSAITELLVLSDNILTFQPSRVPLIYAY